MILCCNPQKCKKKKPKKNIKVKLNKINTKITMSDAKERRI